MQTSSILELVHFIQVVLELILLELVQQQTKNDNHNMSESR